MTKLFLAASKRFLKPNLTYDYYVYKKNLSKKEITLLCYKSNNAGKNEDVQVNEYKDYFIINVDSRSVEENFFVDI